MRVTVKYCGGCNPRYDRRELVVRLQEALGPQVEWSAAYSRAETPDVVLVLCGCAAACAKYEGLEGRHGKLVIRREDEYAPAFEHLSRLRESPAAYEEKKTEVCLYGLEG